MGRPSRLLPLSAACLALWLSASDGPATSSAVARVGIDQPAQTLAVGESFTFTATVEALDGAPTTVAWSSSATGIAPIAVGEVAALTPGVATVTARSTIEPRHADRVDVTVTAASDGIACAEPIGPSTTASADGVLLVRYRDDGFVDGSVRMQASTAGAGIALAAGGTQVRRGAAGEPDLLRVPVAAVEATLAALRALPQVAHAVPDVPVRSAAVTDDPFYRHPQWNLSGFGADAAWARVDGAGMAGVGSTPWVRLLPVQAWPDTSDEDALTSLAAVERAIRWAAGVTVVAAAGNTGTGAGVAYPARAGAIAVGSVDADYRRSDFSSYRAGLTLVAPGGYGPGCGSVLSSGLEYDAGAHAVTHAYTCMAGTSMAVPYAVGAVALLIGSDTSLRDRPEAIAERLVAAARGKPGGSVSEFGAGILCLDALLAEGVCGAP